MKLLVKEMNRIVPLIVLILRAYPYSLLRPNIHWIPTVSLAWEYTKFAPFKLIRA